MGCYFGNRFWYRGWYCGCTVGIIFGTEGVLWESFLVQGGELWGTGGNHFLVKRGVQWVAFLVQGVVVWVYCGKQFLVLRCVLWVALLILRGYVGIHVWYCGNKEIVGQGWHYGRTPCAAQKYPTEEGKRSMVLCEF